ncbi:hypothetical protein ACT048_25005 [Ectopseudomonas khazarica]|uniref:hypothetical protein n=1 Tax=Ectopseudomonas khazarica TaxID=2502979 RepID=UPI0040340857
MKIDIDYNGIILTDPIVLEKVDKHLSRGDNLLERYTTESIGDEVLQKGAIVPILAIDAGSYTLEILESAPPDLLENDDILINKSYALKIEQTAYVSDLDFLMSWNNRQYKLTALDLSPGTYEVSIVGFRKCSSIELLDAGYKIYFSRVETLPAITADTGKNMRVNYPFGDSP